jgi:Zn-dependent M16 (insulinase) family peptidase
MPLISFTGKCLNRNQGQMFDILHELTATVDFSDHGRLHQLLLEYRAGLEAAVVHNGHRLAISLASRNFTPASHLQEMWGGVFQLQTIKRIAARTDDGDVSKLAADLRSIGGSLFCRDNLQMALIGEREMLDASVPFIDTLVSGLSPDGHADRAPFASNQASQLPFEGWRTSTAVSFVAQTFPAVRLGHADSPALSVIAKMLRSLFLHREIREKGGAYGGFALYNAEDGLFSFGSYRDPHIVNTLDVYSRAGAFIRSGDFTDEDVKEAILQVCSEIDKPDPPGPAARKAFFRRMVGLSDETRMQHKTRLLELTRGQVMAAADRYFGDTDRTAAVAVISSPDLLEAANGKLTGRSLSVQTI